MTKWGHQHFLFTVPDQHAGQMLPCCRKTSPEWQEDEEGLRCKKKKGKEHHQAWTYGVALLIFQWSLPQHFKFCPLKCKAWGSSEHLSWRVGFFFLHVAPQSLPSLTNYKPVEFSRIHKYQNYCTSSLSYDIQIVFAHPHKVHEIRFVWNWSQRCS